MIRLKVSSVLLHSSVWLLFMTIPLLFMNQDQHLNTLTETVTIPYLQFCALYMAFFYVHTEILIPKLFIPKKHLAYTLSLLLLIALIYVIKPFDRLVSHNQHTPPPPPPPTERRFKNAPPGKQQPSPSINFDITGIFIFLMLMGLGSALQAMKQWQLFEKRALRAEAEKAQAELSFLRAQINPHFLYNTLNNIYTLCITGNSEAAESIMKLSKIMRYVTDEAEADFVPLQDEIDCISNFIALQQLRIGKKVKLNYTVTGDYSNQYITPLLMISFVENAFKYGLSNHLESSIDIFIAIESGKIVFGTKNKIFDRDLPEKRKGVGIENTKRRLEHLYPEGHRLDFGERNGYFQVLLVVNTKQYL